jgi:hypothetical protein
MIGKLCLRLAVALFLGGRIAALVTSPIVPAGDQAAAQNITAGQPDSRGNRFAEPRILVRAILLHGLEHGLEHDVALENTPAEAEAAYVVVGGKG